MYPYIPRGINSIKWTIAGDARNTCNLEVFPIDSHSRMKSIIYEVLQESKTKGYQGNATWSTKSKR